MRIMRTYRIETAHRLPHVPEGHKCSRLHGHEYKITVHLADVLHTPQDWVMDFADIDGVVRPILDELDHHYLNEIIDNPTVENLAIWLWDRIKPVLPKLWQIEIWETPESGCVYVGV